jgi:tripartite-type tricarboxylate transporter receptor subunit TctC
MSKSSGGTGMALRTGWVLGLSLGLLHLAQAAYPDKPITMIVAFAPGGGTDLTARAIAPFIEKYLGGNAKIIIVNKTGAGGAIGFAQLANSRPDGYTIGMINTPNVLTIPIERNSDFNWQRYDLLGNLVDDPGNFAVHADSPIKNLAELAAFAKSKPGDVSVGTTGAGSDDHLAMLLFEKATGAKMNHIPFKGAADVRTAIAGKQITVAAINVGEAMQALKGGTPIRNLGSMSSARTSLAPDLPTFKEQGFNIELASLRGMAAPKGLPADIRESLVKAVGQAANDPEFKAKAAEIYAPLRYLPPDKYAEALKGAEAQFRALWKEVPWTDK